MQYLLFGDGMLEISVAILKQYPDYFVPITADGKNGGNGDGGVETRVPATHHLALGAIPEDEDMSMHGCKGGGKVDMMDVIARVVAATGGGGGGGSNHNSKAPSRIPSKNPTPLLHRKAASTKPYNKQ